VLLAVEFVTASFGGSDTSMYWSPLSFVGDELMIGLLFLSFVAAVGVGVGVGAGAGAGVGVGVDIGGVVWT